MNYSERYMRVKSIDMVCEGNLSWATSFGTNYIYELNNFDKTVSIIGRLEGDVQSYSYCAIGKYENKLFFAPKFASDIAVFDIETKKTSYIKLDKDRRGEKEVFRETLKFINAITVGDKLFMFGFFYPAIVCLDMATQEVFYVNDWLETVETNLQSGDARGYFGKGTYSKDGFIWIPNGCDNSITKVALDTLKSEVLKLSIDFDGILDFIVDNDKLWLTGQRKSYGRIVCYNLKTQETVNISMTEPASAPNGHYLPQWKLIDYGEYIWLFPYTAHNSYKINKQTYEVQTLDYVGELTDRYDEFGELANALMIKQNGNIVYIVTFDGIWIEVDMKGETAKKYEYKAPKDIIMMEAQMMIQTQICFENKIGIENYLDIVKEMA